MGREDLPDSIFKTKTQPLSDFRPLEVETLANRSEKVVPLPKGKERLRGLAQYKGRSKQGRKNSLGNLRRNVTQKLTNSEPPQLPSGALMPTIPTQQPSARMESSRERRTRAVMSKEEWDLFLETWSKFLEMHPDYNAAEDEMDLHTVCMEEVMKWRFLLLMQKRPDKRDVYGPDYNQAHLRQQKARENLAARRSDRLGLTSKNKNVQHTKVNIAVIAGSLDEKKILELQEQARRNAFADMDYLKNLKDVSANLDVIDAEIVEEVDNSVPALPPGDDSEEGEDAESDD